MKLHELIFCAACAALAAGSLWLGSVIEEPFFVCACAFIAAFWGALAGLCVWGRISEAERAPWPPSVIWPHGRRPQ